MKKIVFIFSISLLNLYLSFSQTKSEIDTLLNGIAKTENSKEITKTEQAKRIISFGEKSLKILAGFFTDSTLTKVKSECQERNLTKGEIAIIMADRIEGMPYATITGVQNCLLTFCEENLNLIEFYLWAIKDNGKENFKEKYLEWLESDERIEWRPLIDYKTKSERKKEIRKRKREKKNNRVSN
ncbi:hypothetical protein [Aquimarina algiphila]|uniref:hypothetical protein n=1 Tax=Aquimarina algiphila TaxID=2047982 RepID=UPI0023300070|nr:hypothetical protein [Aquimarina algiphila]